MNPLSLALGIGILTVNCLAPAQRASGATRWEGWQPLIGFWVGEEDSVQGSSHFSFLPDLRDKVLVRKNHAEYPATKDRPAIVHDDLMIIYGDSEADRNAIYFDNEGHVIEYTVSFSQDRKAAVFVSRATAGAPRYRLSYFQQGSNRCRITFEIAPPGKPEAFAPYLEGFARRKV
jgi:hypothetical protein